MRIRCDQASCGPESQPPPSIGNSLLEMDGATATATGMDVNGECFDSGPCQLQFGYFVRPFMVTSPGAFVLTASIATDARGSNRIPFPGCAPEVDFSHEFLFQPV